MKCPHCATDNFPGEDYCANCGNDLRDAGMITPDKGLGAKVLTDTIQALDPPDPLTVSPDSTVREAVDLMRRKRHGSVLIVDDGKLKGIFTERDLLKRVVVKKLKLDSVKISAVMTKDPQSLGESDSIAFALNRMSVNSIRHVPVIKDDEPIGFISVRGMLKYLAMHTLERV